MLRLTAAVAAAAPPPSDAYSPWEAARWTCWLWYCLLLDDGPDLSTKWSAMVLSGLMLGGSH